MAFRDLLQVIAVALLWATCYPLIGVAVVDAPPLSIGAVRAQAAGIVVLGIAWVQRRPLPTRRDFGLISASGLSLTGLGFAGMFLAGGRASPALATVLANVQPLLAAVLGIFVLGERMNRQRGGALAVGFTGIVVAAFSTVSGGETSSTGLGIGFVLLGAIGVAIGNVVLKRVADRVDPLIAVGWSLTIGAIPLWLLAKVVGETFPNQMTISLVASVAALTLLGTALVAVLWLDLLRRHELVELNIFTFLTPVFGLILSFILFAQPLTVYEWTGAALIMVACLVMQRSHRSAPDEDATS